MLNKKRQELIIQNLKSISSQVRLMSVEQLLNFPSMPAQEKIKYLEPCLQDSEESVQNAARIAISKLGGKPSSFSAPSVAQNQIQEPSPLPQENTNQDSTGFELPSLFDLSNDSQPLPSSQEMTNAPLMPNNKPMMGNMLPKTDESLGSQLPDLSSLLGEPTNTVLPNLSKPAPSQQPIPSNNGIQGRPTQQPSFIQPQVTQPSPIPAPPQTPNQTPQFSQSFTPTPAPATPQSLKSSDIIDDAVDPSLPKITSATDIAFQIQHIKEIANTKPTGFLTRLFELSKSVHEEVALTALQTLFNVKDKRVPSHVLALLNDSSFTSQRRFLMLKIVMETDSPLNADLLENILINEKDVIIKSGLVKVFAKNCNQNGIPLLIRCLNDEDPRVRANTVEVIETQHITGCEQEIIKLLNDSENRVKVNAAKYLVKIGYQQAFFTLRAMLVSPEVWLRDSVIFALGEIADQSSLILLRAALKDPNQGIRLSVLKSLARINNNMARQILKAACGDPDPIVAQVAISLFEKIKDTPVAEDKPTVVNNIPATQTSVAQPPIQNNTSVPHNQIPQRAANIPTPQNIPVQPGMPVQPNISASMQGNVNKAPSMPIPQGASSAGSQQQMSLPSLPAAPSNSGLPDLSGLTSPIPPAPPVPPASPIPPAPPMPQAPQTASQLPNLNVIPTASAGSVMPTAPKPPVPPNPVIGNRPVAAPKPLTPPRPVMPVRRPPTATVAAPNLPPGSPNFEKPRSAAIYLKLCSDSVDEQRNGMKDVAFVMGQDQMALLAKAIKLSDESIRITAVKLLSRKRTPDAKEMLVVLSQDTNETVSSLAKKALMIMR